MSEHRIIHGDCRAVLPTLGADSVQCCVTSPPYFGLRDYGHADQIGLEATSDEFVTALVDVFREVRRVLRDDGVLWLNLGDSYARGGCGARDPVRWPKQARNDHMATHTKRYTGLKPKDMVGIPWMVAFALRADGWYLRSDIIWHKPNPMPESVTDRPTSAHEHVFLLTKQERYFYDAAAIAEPSGQSSLSRLTQDVASQTGSARANGGAKTNGPMRAVGGEMRNARSVWTIATQPYRGAHFATMPPALVERCILAGSRQGDVVLDPFGGAGTTALVADRLQRRSVSTEINTDYATQARRRVQGDAPLLTSTLHEARDHG